MAEDFKVQGADALHELGKRLKAAGGPEVVKELQKALRLAAKPVTPATRAEALRRLPSTGGSTKRAKKDPLNKRVAKAPQRVTARVGNTTASVRVTVAGKKSGAYGANVGKLRHPVFARKGQPRKWVSQNVRPGWFDDPAERVAETSARDEIVDVMNEFAKRLTRPL